MGIDWFTFGAQIVNFLILAALLKKFLYGPIINAMDDREQRIAARLEEAGQKKREAEQEAETYRQQRREFDEQTEGMLAEARRTADDRREELLREARQAVQRTKQEWYSGLKRQQQSLLREIRTETGGKAVQIAHHALRELADKELEDEIVRTFLGQIDRLEPQKRQALAEAMSKADGQVIVRTAFDVSDQSRRRIQDVLRDKLGADSAVGFKTAEELICGIELKAGGRKIGWSFQDFLESLEFDFERAIAEKATDSEKQNGL